MKSPIHSNAQITICELSMEQTRNLFWAAFLFTGDQKTTEDALLRAMGADSKETATNEGSDALRAAVLSEVLCTLYPQLALSRRRTEVLLLQNNVQAESLPDSGWSIATEVKPEDFQRTLLDIDIFPRCVLLLTVYEKFSLDQVAGMLEATKKLTAVAQAIALNQLTRGIAHCQGWRESLRNMYLSPSDRTMMAAH